MFSSAGLVPWYHLPFLSAHRLDGQACFYELATTYGLFGPGTRKKTIKDKLTFDYFNIPKQVSNCLCQNYHIWSLILFISSIFFLGVIVLGSRWEPKKAFFSGNFSWFSPQDWASETGGHARALGMHALHLYTRSSSSRISYTNIQKTTVHVHWHMFRFPHRISAPYIPK